MQKLVITADEATGLLADTDYVHNYKGGGGVLIGIDYKREDAIKAFHDAEQIEIGGENCKAMKHPIVVWKTNTDHSFFEADMKRVDALEEARAANI